MATMISGLGGSTGYGEHSFLSTSKTAGNNDDGSVRVDVTTVFGSDGLNIGGTNYTDIFVNSNGSITFDAADTSPNPIDVGSYPSPIIAAFWDDININDGGDILWDVDPTTGKITVTWLDVAPYSGTGTNSFQVVLTNTGNGDFDVQMHYEDMQWDNNAVGGVSDGGSNDFTLTGSATSWDNKNWQAGNFDNDKGTYQINVTGGTPVDHEVTPDGVIDGSDGDDNFSLGLGDLTGDVVTTADDVVEAGGGDDTIFSSSGDDTVHGGDGSDSIDGGAGDDVIYGEGNAGQEATSGTTTTIDISTYSDTSSGYTVSARNVVGGTLGSANVNNIDSFAGSFGADGTISDSDSGVSAQIGYDKASGVSEQLIVDFDSDLDELSFSFYALFTESYGEQAQWTIFNDGSQIAQSTFTEIGAGSGTGTVDISGHGLFDRIIFTSLLQSDGTDGSDYLITDIGYSSPFATSYDDTIDGGDGADTIDGGMGDDSLLGGEGNDSIDAGDGNDVVTGGSGGDTITGGAGDDYIDGGEGDDYLTTGIGNDTLVGGEGDDTLKNSVGDDSLVGGIGNDLIVATAGNDTLEGGDGSDTLDGGSEDDSIEGGAGDDVIYTGLGDDVASGGDGADIFHVYGAEGVQFNQTGTDGLALASGLSDFPTDELSFEIQFSSDFSGPGMQTFVSYATSAKPNEFMVRTDASGNLEVFMDGSGSGTIADISSLLDGNPHSLGLTWDSTSGALKIYSDGAEIYSGTHLTGATLTQGGTLVLGQEQDSVGGGFETDEIFEGEIHNAKLFDDVRTPAEMLSDAGDHEADTSNPNLIAGWIPDADAGGLTDLTGNHTMTVSGNTQIVTGLGGNDTITGGEGGTDSDTIDLSALSGPVTVTYTGDEAGTITDGTDTVTFSEIENLVLTDLADSVDSSASNGDITIIAGGGNDTVVGGTGDHYISGGAGNDVLYGGNGNSTLDGGSGDDTLYANFYRTVLDHNVYIGGDDTDTFVVDGTPVQGYSYNINLITGVDNYANTYSGIETVIGGAGADTLTGDANDNRLEGRDNADRFRFEDNFGNDTIVGGEGGIDSDTIDLSALTGPVTVNYTGDEAGTITDGTDTITFSEIENFVLTDQSDFLTARDFGDSINVDAGGGNDSVKGSGSADTIYGGDGNDTIDVMEGDDLAYGGDGNDLLLGHNGKDTLYGDAGNDYIW